MSPSLPNLLAGQDLPASPQQERSRLKRQKLLDAALLLFQEHGYDATSIEDIAQQAGVAVGGFYQHFRSKRQVLLVLMDGLLQELSQMDLQLGAEANIVTLEHIVRKALSVDWAYAGAYRAWREAILQDSALSGFNRQVTDWTRTRLLNVLKGMQQLPGTRPNLDMETMAWVLDLWFWQLAGTPADNLDAVVRVVTDLLYHALFQDERSLG
jgi:AcrR family transcriptional regulator